jgi:hypothetical protein
MKIFKVKKKSGTYSELLEAYGLANLLRKILDAKEMFDTDISINMSEDSVYKVKLSNPLLDEMLDSLSYFPLFKYIKKKIESDVSLYSDCYDYPVQKEWKKERQNSLKKIYKDYKGPENKEKRENAIKQIEKVYSQEKPIIRELDVISQIIIPNNFPGFNKLYENLFDNKDYFSFFIKEIVDYYTNPNYDSKNFDKTVKSLSFKKKITATQLYNPSQGQGVNKVKADGLNSKNFDALWISESMKVSGVLSDMICQLIKVGNSYDLKIFVPEYKEVNYSFKSKLIPEFKRHLKGNTPIKIDILNILLLTQIVIEHLGYTGLRKKVKDIVSGLHSVYQKDLGQNKAVVNIGFIQVPDFIEISSEKENEIWIDILEEQRKIVGSISELGSTTQGLMLYRNFISGGDIDNFFKFAHWYSIYLLTELSNKRKARVFSIEILNKFYNSMDTNNELNLSEIINNKGFLAVAKAIRKSTVTLLYTPKDARTYEIRYGIAQTLQSKSKSKEDLAEFVGDFISLYNAETAMKADRDIKIRRNVRDDELTDFYLLLDKYPSKLIGALLASYGFALQAKDASSASDDEEDEIINEENND